MAFTKGGYSKELAYGIAGHKYFHIKDVNDISKMQAKLRPNIVDRDGGYYTMIVLMLLR